MSILLHSGFLNYLRSPWKTEFPWKFALYWNIFYHSGFLSILRLRWKQSLPWIHSIEYIFFIIQDFLATCACPENKVSLKFFKTEGAAASPDPPPRTPMLFLHPDSQNKHVRHQNITNQHTQNIWIAFLCV